MANGSARASLHGGTTSSASRGVLFGQLLRGGPARSGPIYDRLGPDGVAHIVTVLSPAELTLLAALVFDPARVERAHVLSTATLCALVKAAERPDADRALDVLPFERAAELRRALCGDPAEGDRGEAPAGAPRPRGHGDGPRRVRSDSGVGVVLRLRRLFRL